MEKYIGNKTSLLGSIDAYLKEKVPGAASISDLFAGTTNVGRYFRARGWRTLTCDSNRFSYVLAHAYLRTTTPPTFDQLGNSSCSQLALESLEKNLERTLDRYGHLYLPGISAGAYCDTYASLCSVLARLQEVGEKNTVPGEITDYYTQWGTRSAYQSLRGTTGLRNYFSQSNALVIDGILRELRKWWREDRLTYAEIFVLLSAVIEEVVITANVNGTFHDFNRTRIWPNAQQAFRLKLPVIGNSIQVGEIANADASIVASTFGSHDVCYLDPPYNFRQYGAYYHLLNLIPAIPFLEDVGGYMAGVSQVRGQNPEDNFTSDFCFRDRFITSLRGLINAVNAEHVVLSYYSGRNHWNHWSAVEVPTDEGKDALTALFSDKEIFNEFEVIPILDVRLNYQSRVGEQKGLINEHLFYGKKNQNRKIKQVQITTGTTDSNTRWGVADDFRYLPGSEVKAVNDLLHLNR